MTLTPRRRAFLLAAIADGGRAAYHRISCGSPASWNAGDVQLTDKSGDSLSGLGLIEIDVTRERSFSMCPYRITDAGRKAVA